MRVGRSGSLEGSVVLVLEGELAVEVVPELLVVSEVRRLMVGRSGSVGVAEEAGSVVPVVVLAEPELSLRFMTGRSGSSAGSLVEVLAVLEVVVPEVSRRFMVGRSGSSAVLAVVVDVEVVGLVLVVEVVEEPEVSRRFMTGRSGSASASDLAVSLTELCRAGRFLEGLRAATRRGAARGWTLP